MTATHSRSRAAAAPQQYRSAAVAAVWSARRAVAAQHDPAPRLHRDPQLLREILASRPTRGQQLPDQPITLGPSRLSGHDPCVRLAPRCQRPPQLAANPSNPNASSARPPRAARSTRALTRRAL